MRLFAVALLLVLTGCANTDVPTGRGCPDGWTYHVAEGIVKTSWRDYCLSPDESQTVDPHWVYEDDR